MQIDQRNRLSKIQDFDQLVDYLRDEMDWPISAENFEESTFDYKLEELGIDVRNAAEIREIKRLRPFDAKQPWGIFFIKFEPKHLPVVALRRILGRFAIKQRNTNGGERRRWPIEDLLFVSISGQDQQRRFTFAHFTPTPGNQGLPVLRVLDWNQRSTALRLKYVDQKLREYLAWPSDQDDKDAWRKQWRDAFTVRYRHTVNTSRDLSVRLAELARDIRERIKAALEVETEKGHITRLLKSFQKTLVHDIDHDGFSDMVAQTIAYGLLSARITNPEQSTAIDLTNHMRTNPLLSDLMAVFLNMGVGENEVDFDELGVAEVEEFLSNTHMELVIRDFGDRNPREDPVMHFYENFLAEYDREKKIERGVFYTPRPVVSYIVNSIDALLRSEFGLTDGLADTSSWSDMAQKNEGISIPDNISPEMDFVQILDPATGTGTFLVEVIDLIHSTLKKRWKDQGHSEERIASLWNEYVPKHLLSRLYGYELMMAPYVIAHFKISLKLYKTGYRFGSNERARIYLTNALEPSRGSKQLILASEIPALKNEALQVDKIKSSVRFTVVLGNPPYSGHSANKGDWIKKLLRGNSGARNMENYFHVDGEPLNERNPKWLNDDYVKFTRFAHWQIERTGQGIIGFITNHGYLDNPTFRGMRESLVSTFPIQYLLDLHGNAKKKERSPDGGKDQNVFDIQQGVAIGVFVKSVLVEMPRTNHFDLWGIREQDHGNSKYDFLAKNSVRTTEWEAISPVSPYWFFIPHDSKLWGEYKSGWKLTDIFPVNSVGIVTARDKLTIQFTEEEMKHVVEKFVDLDTEDARRHYGLNKDARDWKVKLAQEDIKDRDGEIYPILYRPFDTRFTYYSGKSRGFICMPRPKVMRHMLAGENLSITFHKREELRIGYSHFLCSRDLTEHGLTSSKTTNYQAPLYLYTNVDKASSSLFEEWREAQTKLIFSSESESGRIPNLYSSFVDHFSTVLRLRFISDGRGDLNHTFGPEDVVAWIYAIFYSVDYRRRYDAQLKLDFPYIPLPKGTTLFQRLALMGYDLLALHLLESPNLNNLTSTYFGPKNCVVGKVGWSDNTIWLNAENVNASKGYRAVKNGTFGFQGVSEKVWDFHIGSYRVLQKWLAYRKGRILTDEDIIHYSKVIVVLNETIPIMAGIDETIEAHGGWPEAFDRSTA